MDRTYGIDGTVLVPTLPAFARHGVVFQTGDTALSIKQGFSAIAVAVIFQLRPETWRLAFVTVYLSFQSSHAR